MHRFTLFISALLLVVINYSYSMQGDNPQNVSFFWNLVIKSETKVSGVTLNNRIADFQTICINNDLLQSTKESANPSNEDVYVNTIKRLVNTLNTSNGAVNINNGTLTVSNKEFFTTITYKKNGYNPTVWGKEKKESAQEKWRTDSQTSVNSSTSVTSAKQADSLPVVLQINTSRVDDGAVVVMFNDQPEQPRSRFPWLLRKLFCIK